MRKERRSRPTSGSISGSPLVSLAKPACVVSSMFDAPNTAAAACAPLSLERAPRSVFLVFMLFLELGWRGHAFFQFQSRSFTRRLHCDAAHYVLLAPASFFAPFPTSFPPPVSRLAILHPSSYQSILSSSLCYPLLASFLFSSFFSSSLSLASARPLPCLLPNYPHGRFS